VGNDEGFVSRSEIQRDSKKTRALVEMIGAKIKRAAPK
jgi:hypothetical protein